MDTQELEKQFTAFVEGHLKRKSVYSDLYMSLRLC